MPLIDGQLKAWMGAGRPEDAHHFSNLKEQVIEVMLKPEMEQWLEVQGEEFRALIYLAFIPY